MNVCVNALLSRNPPESRPQLFQHANAKIWLDSFVSLNETKAPACEEFSQPKFETEYFSNYSTNAKHNARWRTNRDHQGICFSIFYKDPEMLLHSNASTPTRCFLFRSNDSCHMGSQVSFSFIAHEQVPFYCTTKEKLAWIIAKASAWHPKPTATRSVFKLCSSRASLGLHSSLLEVSWKEATFRLTPLK